MTVNAEPDATSLEEAIRDFRERTIQGPRQVEDLRDPEVAEGNCLVLSAQFSNFLRTRGLSANVGLPGYDCFGEMHPDVWGYQDREIQGCESHAATTCEIDGKTYMIDWTASQYGYQQFPMIQVMAQSVAAPVWERVECGSKF